MAVAGQILVKRPEGWSGLAEGKTDGRSGGQNDPDKVGRRRIHTAAYAGEHPLAALRDLDAEKSRVEHLVQDSVTLTQSRQFPLEEPVPGD